MTEAQRALYVHNLTLARDFIKTLNPERLNLEQWCDRDNTCGTLYCTAGWLTTHPFFGQFMKIDENDVLVPTFIPAWTAARLPGEAMAYKYRWLDALFGPDAFDHIFSAEGEGAFDDELLDDITLTDHQLAVCRLELAIERIENMPVESAAG